MDESKFCSACGKPIEPGMQFCPKCGTVVSGSEADEEFKEKQKEILAIVSDMRRNWLLFFLAIYAIPAVIVSIIALVDASSTAETIFNSDAFQTWIHNHKLNITQSDLQNYITWGAVMGLLSGICAGVSLVCVYIRKKWIVAVVACLAASILCFWSVLGVIIGFLVTWMIVGSKEIFIDQPADAEED